MRIKSISPIEPGFKVCVRTEWEKGSDGFKENFMEYDILAWAVVDPDNDDNDRVEPMYIGQYGAPVVFSQHVLEKCGEPGFSDMDFEIDDSEHNKK
ncbi:hypothetical protein phiRKBJ001_107 [Streptomyces phage phiRKBJ001]|nr:hypothetical protein phiRKBJ001_107 [Streptomyces phage phiRKBJ001]